MSITGIVGSALETVASPVTSLVSGATDALATAGLNEIGSWVLSGTESALRTVAQVIGSATAPNLESTWFGSAYWRVAGLAALLTLPFLLAAAVQALVRSDLALLLRSAFLYLPLSLLGVGLAAPFTMLLLAATDEMSSVVSAVGVEGGARFLDSAAGAAGSYSAAAGSPFYAVVVGLLALMAALALAVEMLIREAAVYVVVLMLPLGFAAMVWPARRIWATRLIELLISLILSKFVIVAVLSLAGSAFASGSTSGISKLLVAMTLVMLSVFAPWTLMRILPFTEVAAGAAGALRRELPAFGYQDAAKASMGMVDPALGLAAKLALGSTDLGGGGSGGGRGGDSDAGSAGDSDRPLDGFAPGRPSLGGPGGDGGGAADAVGEFEGVPRSSGGVFDYERLGTEAVDLPEPPLTGAVDQSEPPPLTGAVDQSEPPPLTGAVDQSGPPPVTTAVDQSGPPPATEAPAPRGGQPSTNRLETMDEVWQRNWKPPALDTALVSGGLELTGSRLDRATGPELTPSIESSLGDDAAPPLRQGSEDTTGDLS